MAGAPVSSPVVSLCGTDVLASGRDRQLRRQVPSRSLQIPKKFLSGFRRLRISRFGVLVRNRDGQAQPALFAPVLGSPAANAMHLDQTDAWRYGAYPRPAISDRPAVANEVRRTVLVSAPSGAEAKVPGIRSSGTLQRTLWLSRLS